MDPGNGRKIEVFAPFGAAFDLTKLILFQPFDIGKWFTIGFAAFLSHLAGGGASGFNYNSKLLESDWNWKVRSASQDTFGSGNGMPAWVIPLIIIGVLIVLALVVLLIWLSARGKFVFTDCIVRNRGAIVEPWNEFKKEGNSYLLFSLLLLLCVLVILGLAALPLGIPFVFGGEKPGGVFLILGLTFFGLIALFTLVVFNLISSFMIPVMYRRRCGAREAFHAVLAAISAHPGPVILYLLFSIVLWLAVAMAACVTTCLTCCITAIPYLGTVILLPLYVFLMSYLLLFVRQFGNEYDAWANLIAVEPTSPPPLDPPASEPPRLPA